MFINQISVFIDTKPGNLAKITGLLKKGKIDIRAFNIGDTTEFGILRLIVREPERGVAILRDAGFTAQLNQVLVAVMQDKIGSFDEIVGYLAEENIDIKYLYSFIGEVEATGRVAICTDDMKAAAEVLKNKGVQISAPDEI